MKETATNVARSIHKAVLNGGPPARKLADLLHGTWLGHPLHAVLTDVTVGAFSLGTLFDLLGEMTGDDGMRQAADLTTAAGVLSAVPTALSGLADFSTVPKPAAATAALHGSLNSVALGLYLVSLKERSAGHRRAAVAVSLSAFALSGLTAWLGGHLVYSHKVGVDRSGKADGPKAWTDALDAEALAEGTLRCVDVEDHHVLLNRQGESIRAIAARCSHAAGKLEDGMVEGITVRCPLHDSVFDLRDGSVVFGPAVHPQLPYEARIKDGKIQVRAKQGS